MVKIIKNLDKGNRYKSLVELYKNEERKVLTSFVDWITALWGILAGHRELLKEKGIWYQFCTDIWISPSKAGAQIRLFEYVNEPWKKIQNRSEIIAQGITNWKKMQGFLSLEEEEKEEVIKKIWEGTITNLMSSEDFMEEIWKGIKLPEDVLDGVLPSDKINWSVKVNKSESDLPTEMLVEAIRKKWWFSKESVPFIESIVSMTRKLEDMDKNINIMAKIPEKDFEEMINSLTKISDKIRIVQDKAFKKRY